MFCPFSKDSCRKDCVFYHDIGVVIEYGECTHCKLALAAQHLIDKAEENELNEY